MWFAVVRITVRTAYHAVTLATPHFIQFEINFLVGTHVSKCYGFLRNRRGGIWCGERA